MDCPVSFVCAEPDSEFEVANDLGKVRCTICLANNSCEPWINRSSATAHAKSERHRHRVAARRRQVDETARDNERWKEATLEAEKLSGDSFVPTDTVPSVRVMRNEPVAALSRLQTDEEEEMMRSVLRHLDDTDPDTHPIEGWKVANQSLEAQVAQVIAGNLDVMGPSTEDDNFLADVMSTVCSSIPPPLPRHATNPEPLQPRSYLFQRLNTLRSGNRSQIRRQNGIHTRARRFVPLIEQGFDR